MKTVKTIALAVGAAALIGLAIPAVADMQSLAESAAPAAPVAQTSQSYAFVDMTRIMDQATVAKSVVGELSAKKLELKTDFDKKSLVLQTEGKTLMKQRATLSKEEYEKKANALQVKMDSFDKQLKARRGAFEGAGQEAFNKVRDLAAEYVKQIAQENKYAAVFARQAVVIGAKNLDITDEVIARMNKSAEKVTIDWNATPQKAQQ